MTQLQAYRHKRDFRRTPEPKGRRQARKAGARGLAYLIQKHAASRLHYDLRLEMDGALKSWAVPRGPSLDPQEKRLAVHVEDHPLEYGSFEGTIPPGQYGAGTVLLWDRGTWEPLGDIHEGYERGRLKFLLHGQKLHGQWTLARMRTGDGKADNWLLIKHRDEYAHPASRYDTLQASPLSVATRRTMEQVAEGESGRTRASNAPRRAAKTRDRHAGRQVIDVDPSLLPGARREALPESIRPQLASLVDRVPAGEGWLHEIKFDGYRMLCRIDGSQVRLMTRNGHDWTNRFGVIGRAIRRLPLTRAILDGEIVVLDAKGVSDFQALQNVLRKGQRANLYYYLFDLPYCEGYDLSATPLAQRKQLLRQLLADTDPAGPIRYSDHIAQDGQEVYRQACAHDLEGIVSKQAASRYKQRRSGSWVKLKCKHQQEFVIGGYTDPSGSRELLGALLLGYYDHADQLQYAGKVGTGFDGRNLRMVYKEVSRRTQAQPAFGSPPSGPESRGVHWTRPDLVAAVEFSGWTEDGRLRHPSFQGLRQDKPAREVVLERPVPTIHSTDKKHDRQDREMATRYGKSNGTAHRAGSEVAGVRLSNPGRVIYPEQGLTKLDLARYYEAVADWILPHIIHRPLSLVRCPRGREGKCFYQKHLNETLSPPVRGVAVMEKGEKALYVVVDDLSGLITLVQFGVLELHPWGSREDHLERPDRMIFDLDPGPGIEWQQVVEAAQQMREVLDAVRLTSYVKTTGGKGLHVVVPLVRRNSWDEVRGFSESLARQFAKVAPSRYVAIMTKARRSGRIFVDYLRNDRGSTAVAAYCTRARPNAPVSTPLAWEELASVSSADTFTVTDLPERLSSLRGDPWRGFFDIRQSITKATLARMHI